MQTLQLPEFRIPELPEKKMTALEIHHWILQNLKRLEESGQLKLIQKQKERCPANVRFTLK